MDAEKEKLTTCIGVYRALLWTYDLLRPMNDVAGPARDCEGLAVERLKGRRRARASEELDSDFWRQQRTNALST